MSEYSELLEKQNAPLRVYRKNLADKLKSEPDKDRRMEMLAEEKSGGYYWSAHRAHLDERFFGKMNEKFNGLISKATTFQGLIDSITEERDLILRNNGYGWDHVENILKRLEMAKKIADSDLIPNCCNLREKAISLMIKEGTEFNKDGKEGKYQEYLKDRFPELNFGEGELEKITAKISPDIFATVDIRIEKIVMLINSLDGAETRFSCAGHFDEEYTEVKQREEHLSSYVAFQTDSFELRGTLRALYVIDGVEMKVNKKENQKTGNVWIGQDLTKPPLIWIVKNGKKTFPEIVRKSKKLLEQYFGSSISSSKPEELRQETKELQAEMLRENPKKAILPMATDSSYLREIDKLLPESLARIEYKEYFDKNMSQVVQRRDKFISLFESLLKNYRNRVAKRKNSFPRDKEQLAA
jgi:hypothetical protein